MRRVFQALQLIDRTDTLRKLGHPVDKLEVCIASNAACCVIVSALRCGE